MAWLVLSILRAGPEVTLGEVRDQLCSVECGNMTGFAPGMGLDHEMGLPSPSARMNSNFAFGMVLPIAQCCSGSGVDRSVILESRMSSNSARSAVWPPPVDAVALRGCVRRPGIHPRSRPVAGMRQSPSSLRVRSFKNCQSAWHFRTPRGGQKRLSCSKDFAPCAESSTGMRAAVAAGSWSPFRRSWMDRPLQIAS